MGRRPDARGHRTQRSRDAHGTRGSVTEVQQLLGDFESAVAVTRLPSGLPRVRPITLEDPAELPGSDLWFVTSREIGADTGDAVGVCCFGPEPGAWLSLAAVARLDEDRQSLRRLWGPEHRAVFPGGPDDPDLVIVRLDVVRAELWLPIPGHLRVVYELLPPPSTDLHAHP